MLSFNWLEICGWLGGILYSVFGIPQTISIVYKGNASGLNIGMLILMVIGALCSLLYIIPQGSLPLISNFTLSLICALLMLRYKIWEHKK